MIVSFKEWVRQQFTERKWSQSEAAIRSGIDVSNISRMLKGKTQPTLRIATRLCYGLGMSLPEVLASWLGRQADTLPRSDQVRPNAVVTVHDVRVVISCAHADWELACTRFAAMLTVLHKWWASSALTATQQPDPSSTLIFGFNEVRRLLQKSPFYTFELCYPPPFPVRDILSIYRAGGALHFKDAGQYLQQLRRARMEEGRGQRQRSQFAVPSATISHLEAGECDRVLLEDLVALDEQLDQNSQLLGVYWNACELHEFLQALQYPERHEEPFGPRKNDGELAVQFLFLCRWLHLYSHQDSRWVGALRELWAAKGGEEK